MGVAVTRRPELLEGLSTRRSLHGAIPGPLDTWLALRGLRTLALRLERSQANAGELARRLVGHPGIRRVRYPGLATDPGHARASAQMSGFGTILSFEVEFAGLAPAEAAEAVVSGVRLATAGTSLGGVETLIERRGRWAGEQGLPPALIRLSVGIEDVEDLWEDIEQALHRAAG
jgi:cystathionine gamma-synthase